MITVILGMPGAGKTTLGQGLAKMFEAQHISVGDIARAMARVDDEFHKALVAGQLAPKRKMNQAVFEALLGYMQLGETVFIDGYPRYMDQLSDLLAATECNFHSVVLDVRKPTAIERLRGRNRSDDHAAQIDNRMLTFEQETTPVIDWLIHRHDSQFIINADRNADLVLADAIERLRVLW